MKSRSNRFVVWGLAGCVMTVVLRCAGLSWWMSAPLAFIQTGPLIAIILISKKGELQ